MRLNIPHNFANFSLVSALKNPSNFSKFDQLHPPEYLWCCSPDCYHLVIGLNLKWDGDLSQPRSLGTTRGYHGGDRGRGWGPSPPQPGHLALLKPVGWVWSEAPGARGRGGVSPLPLPLGEGAGLGRLRRGFSLQEIYFFTQTASPVSTTHTCIHSLFPMVCQYSKLLHVTTMPSIISFARLPLNPEIISKPYQASTWECVPPDHSPSLPAHPAADGGRTILNTPSLSSTISTSFLRLSYCHYSIKYLQMTPESLTANRKAPGRGVVSRVLSPSGCPLPRTRG